MSKKRHPGKLRLELVAAAFVSILFAFFIYQVSSRVCTMYLDHLADSKTYVQGKAQDMIDLLQEFVNKNHLDLSDSAKLYSWRNSENISFDLYDKDTNRISYYYSWSEKEPVEASVSDEEFEISESGADASGEVTFQDGEKRKVLVYYDRFYSMYNMIGGFSLIVAVIGFVLLFLVLIHRKIRYIRQIAEELKILEGGNLEYAVSVRGSDELTELARGINSMRLAVLRREEEERKNVKLHRDLVTALSHDIRTPMTSLIGYLEILSMKRYRTEEQRNKYLETARQKAFQLKEMSDTLFEYSLVSGKTAETYDMELMPVSDLLMAINDTQIADLISDGWNVQTKIQPFGEADCICVDIDFYRRVLDNLVSNIRKYAIKNDKIVFEARPRKDDMILVFKNRVLKEEPLEGSTGVGLRTCRQILEAMKGEISIERTENIFSVTIRQPLSRNGQMP